MPLFCFKNKILNVGIEFQMKGDDAGLVDEKVFYNIGTERDWILTAMEDNQNKSMYTKSMHTKDMRSVR